MKLMRSQDRNLRKNPFLLKNVAVASAVSFLFIIFFWAYNLKSSCDGSTKIVVVEEKRYVFNKTEGMPDYLSSYAKLAFLLAKTFEGEFKCKKMVRLPTDDDKDGSWTYCEDIKPTPPCVEYSFGIAYDFNFEDAYRERTQCDVLTFDPSMGQPDHQHKPGVMFYNLGIGADKNDNYPGRGYGKNGKAQVWKIDTLANIMKIFNHTKGTVLKIDAEGAEWDSIGKAIDDGTLLKWDQLIFEIHLWGFNEQTVDAVINKWYRFFQKLRENNFLQIYSHVNPRAPTIKFPNAYVVPCCWELSFINVNNYPK